jgi:catechol 2,3-dioxygenase-like lactoylglutathione lyase family enzyme
MPGMPRSRFRKFRQLPVLLLLISGGYLQAQPAPVYAAIDHIEFFVTDLDRALAFYTRVFGNDLWKNRQTERRYLLLGNSYIALEQRTNPAVDHVCFGIDNFDIGAVHAFLDMQGIAWQDYPSGNDLRVDDRNGIRTQLAQNRTWTTLAQTTAAPENYAVREAQVFRPLALDEIYITVTSLEVDSLFYARLLNQTGTLQAGSLWFNVGNARLRISQAPVGQPPGLNYFSVLVSNTDLEQAAEAVFAAGGIIETILPNGFSFWDPDGHRVLVRTTELF